MHVLNQGIKGLKSLTSHHIRDGKEIFKTKLEICFRIRNLKISLFPPKFIISFTKMQDILNYRIIYQQLLGFRNSRWLLLETFVRKVFDTNLNLLVKRVRNPKK